MVLEKILESPWTARRSNQSILKEIGHGCSLEGLMLPTKARLVKAMVFLVVMFLSPYMDVRFGLSRKLSTKELMLLNCGVEEDF